ncbi:gastrula zinc finger protein XlCGF7.1-like [Hyperolius riggenbachi]|uniref:gastrula zinc finger protein XlCGF7.1-like n=1 Tax=Hyperolius riggenbachi TaxID=752182 RepID=UPI0035A38956
MTDHHSFSTSGLSAQNHSDLTKMVEPPPKSMEYPKEQQLSSARGSYVPGGVFPSANPTATQYTPISDTTVESWWNRNRSFMDTNVQALRPQLQYGLSNLSGSYIEQNKNFLGSRDLKIGDLDTDVTPSTVPTPTYCSNCKKMFATIEAYNRHQPMHGLDNKLFPCVECGKYYRHNTALVIHRRTHTGEKPYGCPECGRRFNARSSLVTHGKVHAGKKMYNCTECGLSFARTDDLFNHQLMHNRERKFSCNDCGKCFKAEAELSAHRKIHPVEELYLCSGCGRDFTQYSKLLRHQKTHPMPPPVLITNEKMLQDQ